MLEVVVSMLIIGLGLAMGISMIQTSNRFGNNAEFSHSALEQAQAIIDKMRANRVAAATYRYTGTATLSTDGSYRDMYNAVRDSNAYNSAINGLSVACMPGIDATACAVAGATAQADMQAWRDNIQALLPGGRGLIFIDGTELDVVVMWQNTPETDSAANPDAHGIRLSFTL